MNTLIDNLATQPAKALLDEAALATMFNVSVRTVRRWTRSGELPAPVRFGSRKFWMAGRVLAHVESRINSAEASDARRRQTRARGQTP